MSKLLFRMVFSVLKLYVISSSVFAIFMVLATGLVVNVIKSANCRKSRAGKRAAHLFSRLPRPKTFGAEYLLKIKLKIAQNAHKM